MATINGTAQDNILIGDGADGSIGDVVGRCEAGHEGAGAAVASRPGALVDAHIAVGWVRPAGPADDPPIAKAREVTSRALA